MLSDSVPKRDWSWVLILALSRHCRAGLSYAALRAGMRAAQAKGAENSELNSPRLCVSASNPGCSGSDDLEIVVEPVSDDLTVVRFFEADADLSRQLPRGDRRERDLLSAGKRKKEIDLLADGRSRVGAQRHAAGAELRADGVFPLPFEDNVDRQHQRDARIQSEFAAQQP